MCDLISVVLLSSLSVYGRRPVCGLGAGNCVKSSVHIWCLFNEHEDCSQCLARSSAWTCQYGEIECISTWTDVIYAAVSRACAIFVLSGNFHEQAPRKCAQGVCLLRSFSLPCHPRNRNGMCQIFAVCAPLRFAHCCATSFDLTVVVEHGYLANI